jgi:hypothetical protein
VSCAKTAERIELIFTPETGLDHRHIVLDWGPDPPKNRGVMGENRGVLGRNRELWKNGGTNRADFIPGDRRGR